VPIILVLMEVFVEPMVLEGLFVNVLPDIVVNDVKTVSNSMRFILLVIIYDAFAR
jgi:hypothetical protein